MARQPLRRQNISIQNLPAISFDTGQAALLAKVSDSLFTFAGKIEDRLDEIVANDAEKAGMLRGAEGDLSSNLLFQPTIAGRAFTKSAISSFNQQLDRRARARIDELSAQHSTDPQKLQGAIAQYQRELIQDLPEQLRPVYSGYLSDLGRPYVAKARKALVDIRRNQTEADALLSEHEMTLQLDQIAPHMFSEDTETREASQGYIARTRERLQSLNASTITDDLGNKLPVFTPEEQAKRILAFDKIVTKSAVIGWFEQSKDPIGALEAWGQGLKAEVKDESGEVIGTWEPGKRMTSEERLAVTAEMRSIISSRLSIASALDARADRARELADDNLMTGLLREKDPAVRLELASRIVAMTQDPEVLRKTQALIRNEGARGPSFQEARANAFIMIDRGLIKTAEDVYLLPAGFGLSDEDVAEIAQFVLNRKNSGHWSASREYQAAEQKIAFIIGGTDIGSLRARGLVGSDAAVRENLVNQALSILLQAGFDGNREGVSEAWDPEAIANRIISAFREEDTHILELQAELTKTQIEIGDLRVALRREGKPTPVIEQDPQMKVLVARANGLRDRMREVGRKGIR
jgi:hypothetical protein